MGKTHLVWLLAEGLRFNRGIMPPLLCSRLARLYPIVNNYYTQGHCLRTNPTGQLLHNLLIGPITNTMGVHTTEHVQMTSLWSLYAASKKDEE